MKKIMLLLLVFPLITFAQIKGEKSKETQKTVNGTTFSVGDIITLNKASNEDKFAYVYVKKSMLSLGNVAKAMNTVRDVRTMNVSSVQNVANTVKTVNSIANSELVSSALNQLAAEAVSPSYVDENALSASKEGAKYKIKFFKVYSDKESEYKIVHAIAKGKGKKVAILLDFAEKSGEIK